MNQKRRFVLQRNRVNGDKSWVSGVAVATQWQFISIHNFIFASSSLRESTRKIYRLPQIEMLFFCGVRKTTEKFPAALRLVLWCTALFTFDFCRMNLWFHVWRTLLRSNSSCVDADNERGMTQWGIFITRCNKLSSEKEISAET